MVTSHNLTGAKCVRHRRQRRPVAGAQDGCRPGIGLIRKLHPGPRRYRNVSLGIVCGQQAQLQLQLNLRKGQAGSGGRGPGLVRGSDCRRLLLRARCGKLLPPCLRLPAAAAGMANEFIAWKASIYSAHWIHSLTCSLTHSTCLPAGLCCADSRQTPDATPEEIKKAYYSCMKVCHPDLSGNNPETTAFCMFINEVYEVPTACSPARRNDEHCLNPQSMNESIFGSPDRNLDVPNLVTDQQVYIIMY